MVEITIFSCTPQIQNVLSQSSTAPFNAQESYIFNKFRQKQDPALAPQIEN